MNQWVKEAGENMTLKVDKHLNPPPTPIDSSNSYWMAFKSATDEL